MKKLMIFHSEQSDPAIKDRFVEMFNFIHIEGKSLRK